MVEWPLLNHFYSTYHTLGRSFMERPFAQSHLTSQQLFQKSSDYNPEC